MPDTLYKRSLAEKMIPYLSTNDVVVIHGARQVGKTHLMYYLMNYVKEQGERVSYLDLEDSRYSRMLDRGVDQLVIHLAEEGFEIETFKKKEGKERSRGKRIFVFLDEIQNLDDPSSFLKLAADHYHNLKLVVSGSSSFAIKKKFKDSLVGRTVNFELLPLSFEEFLTFREYPFSPEMLRAGKVSSVKRDELTALFKEFVLVGGYPKIVLAQTKAMRETYLQQIIDTYLKKDIRDLAKVKNLEKFNRLLEVLASQSGNLLNVSELAETAGLAKQTVEEYLFILEQTYIVKRVRPFSGNVRSELFKTPKIYFYDSGLAQMLWLKGLQKEMLGNVFETAVFSELAKRHGKEHIYFWRTMDKKEIDFVMKKKTKPLPIEVKLNFNQFRPTAMTYFRATYRIQKYYVVGLNGTQKNSSFIYPWQL